MRDGTLSPATEFLANHVTRETSDHDIFTEFGNFRSNEFVDRLIRVFDECLIEQTDTAEELVELSVYDFLGDIFRLTFHLSSKNLPFPFNRLLRNLIPTDKQRVRSSDVQRDVFDEVAET